MAVCERCWAEAALRTQDARSQVGHYYEVMHERELAGIECSPAEQCGDRHELVELRDGVMRCRCGGERGDGR